MNLNVINGGGYGFAPIQSSGTTLRRRFVPEGLGRADEAQFYR